MGLPLIVLLIGCGKTAPEPVPDFVTYTPKYVDVVTEKLDTTTSGLTEVKSAVKENTEVLLQLKELVETKPAAGGVEPQEPPSTHEKSPPPAPYYWETDQYYVQYFGATWCGPCRNVKPRLKKSLKRYGADAFYSEFDVDVDKDAVAKAKVKSVPTIVVCQRGVHVDKLVGSQPQAEIDKLLARYFKPVQADVRYKHKDLVQLHDDLHNAASGKNTTWDWDGDLEEHLRTVHGVDL